MLQKIFLEKKPTATDYKNLDAVVIQSDVIMKGAMRYTVASTSFIEDKLTGITITRTIKDSLYSALAKIAGTIKIYPNPVQKGTAFDLTLKLKQSGTYTIQIINATGQMLLQKQFAVTEKMYTEQVQTSNTWSNGMYYIRVLDSNNKMISTNNFLIQ